MPPEFAAIFDWDGVIIDSSAQHEKSWELLSEEIGKPLPPDHFKRGFGKKNEAIIPDIGWASDADEVHRLGLRKETLYRELLMRDGVSPLPGAQQLLSALQAAGIPCAVGSSTHRENIETIFAMTGLGKFFSAVVTSEDIRHGKPAPDVFLRAAECIRAEPKDCVVFEDALVGIAAAKAAGMKCIAVATTNPIHVINHADQAVESLASVDLEMIRRTLTHS